MQLYDTSLLDFPNEDGNIVYRKKIFYLPEIMVSEGNEDEEDTFESLGRLKREVMREELTELATIERTGTIGENRNACWRTCLTIGRYIIEFTSEGSQKIKIPYKQKTQENKASTSDDTESARHEDRNNIIKGESEQVKPKLK